MPPLTPKLLQHPALHQGCTARSIWYALGVPLPGTQPPEPPELRLVAGVQDRGRLDSFLAGHLDGVSRAKIQESIKAGLISLNGATQRKPSHSVQPHDVITGRLLPRQPMEAVPEDVEGALDIVYEDESVLVLNKPPHLVVHPAAGNTRGTLVNALLHHWGAPQPQSSKPLSGRATLNLGEFEEHEEFEEGEGESEADMVNEFPERNRHFVTAGSAASLQGAARGGKGHRGVPHGDGGAVAGSALGLDAIRPGIVHRLDKGTSGLLVVAKDAAAEAHLCAQFKARTTQRTYVAILCGTPVPPGGVVDTHIGRDPGERKRMAVVHPSSRQTSRRALSTRC